MTIDVCCTAQGLLATGLCINGQRERGARLQVDAIERFVRLRSPQMVWTAVESTANVLACADIDTYATSVLWAASDRAPNPPIARVMRPAELPIQVRAKLDADQWNAAQREGASLSMDAAANLARKSAERLAEGSTDS